MSIIQKECFAAGRNIGVCVDSRMGNDGKSGTVTRGAGGRSFCLTAEHPLL